jgi:hypothetical protein
MAAPLTMAQARPPAAPEAFVPGVAIETPQVLACARADEPTSLIFVQGWHLGYMPVQGVHHSPEEHS